MGEINNICITACNFNWIRLKCILDNEQYVLVNSVMWSFCLYQDVLEKLSGMSTRAELGHPWHKIQNILTKHSGYRKQIAISILVFYFCQTCIHLSTSYGLISPRDQPGLALWTLDACTEHLMNLVSAWLSSSCTTCFCSGLDVAARAIF